MQVWPRTRYTVGGGVARIALIALSRDRLPDPLPVSRKRHGMPDEGAGCAAVAIVARDRAEDPAWFVEHVISPFAELIASDLGADASGTALAAEYAYVIEAELADPDDLGHVQAAWALAKCVCEEGASLVIDLYAARAHLGADVAALEPDRAFDIMHEVTLFVDDLPGGAAVAAWSLGLCKFGRPDLVALDIAPDGATEAALLLRDLAAALAAGERIEPGDRVEAPDGRTLLAERFDAARATIGAVEREAILLRPAG